MKVEPPFDSYIFIEKDAEHVACLRQLEREFPDLASRMSVLHGDANEELERLCASSWHTPGRQCRAVLFLDPYGMSVRWSTIEAIARTQAIDLWYFFPLGVAVNRLLRRDGAIPEEWGRRLTDTFGTDTWRGAFYSRRTNLFGEEAITKTADIGRIRDFLLDRLRTIFPAVASNPQMLRNSTGNPLYLLCFAAANERGGRVALRIAEHILKHLRAEGRTHDAGS